MVEPNKKPLWSLPYEAPRPADPRRRRAVLAIQIVLWGLLGGALLVATGQLEYQIIRNHRRAEDYRRGQADGTLSERERLKGSPKPHKGAVGRWRPAIRGLWGGQNIYQSPEDYIEQVKRGQAGELAILHPNMPFTAILLTPFAYLPVWAGGLVFTLLKVLVIIAAALAAAAVVNHENLRMPAWLFALGAAWSIAPLISDIQHANTNGFVLGAIVLHLWLYRRGRDLAAGAALAAAICLKMTPALFVLYWLYQRNWKLLVGCLAAGLLFAVVIPAAALGPGHYGELTETWLDNLIFKGLGGAWYPIHVNQSVPAVLGRYLMDGQAGGNLYWNPDDNPYELQSKFRWIAFTNLSPATVRLIIQAAVAILLGVAAFAVGWRKLPRRDGRRGLHYAMVLGGILLLNQRTWDHHAAILLPACLAVWYAVAFGRFRSRGLRGLALAMMILAGLTMWLSAGGALEAYGKIAGLDKHAAEDFADVAQAYGPKCFCFLLIFLTASVLAIAMKSAHPPYAAERQKLFH